MEIKALVSQMTLEEKAGLCSGLDFWHTKSVERLGVPSVMVSDGPHGLRKQDDKGDHLGINDSIKAVCMPAASATAASFDRDLIRKMGEAIGDSCQHEKLSVVLGPAVNIKRSPLCGRNFEYFSEDPYLAGEMSAAYINGVQSRNVGTSIKHFAANNQEHRRMSSSSNADERTLREIYFPAFETSVKKAQPWTVMCSYNRINGVYASENPWLLTDVLRKEWGFEGYVMSDWGAVSNRVAGVAAGLDLEMPSSGGINDARIVEAVRSGKLDEKLVDQAVERILTINFRYLENAKPETPWDMEAQHLLSADIAADCMVLLKNEGILPLSQDEEAAFIGEFAVKPRFQGGGSSHINCFKTTSALEAAEGKKVTYARGYSVAEDAATDEMIAEAVAAAKKAKVAVVFAGLPDAYESEGYDRSHMRMPDCQNRLIEAVAEVNPNTVVVLHNGSPVEMPWIGKVKAVLEGYLGGQAVGLATVRVLYGEVNPSGHLPETFPVKLSDNPSYLFYGGEGNEADYREGVFVGYRYYDKNNLLISLLAALAEMESQQKSEAIKAGIRWRMAEGIYKFSVQNTLGFYRDHFGRLVIEPTEARIVEYIYESCLEGATPAEIAAALTEQGIKSPMGNDLWSAGTVRSILRNEKYCGDALMQKTYTKDFRTHKSVKNTDLNMYFKENHHTAIIKKEDWIKVQKLLSERHSTAKRATLRRLSNHFVAYRVKDGLFKGYLIMDSRWSFMERQEFMKIVDEAQNTMK